MNVQGLDLSFVSAHSSINRKEALSDVQLINHVLL